MAHLPDELLERVFQNLAISGTAPSLDDVVAPEVHEDRRRLLALHCVSLASRRFHLIVFPILWRTLDFDVIGDRHTRTILTTLCRQRDACHYVQNIKFTVADMQTRLPPPKAEIVVLYSLAVRRLRFPALLRNRLLLKFQRGFQDAEIALIIAMCTATRRLTLTFDEESITDLQGSLIPDVCRGHLLGGSGGLPSPQVRRNVRPAVQIQELEIRDWTVDPDNVPAFPLICDLPALQTLQLRNYVSVSFPRLAKPCMARTIEFVHAYVQAVTVRAMLPSFPALTTLSIDRWVETGVDQVFEQDFGFKEFGTALCQHATRLESLTLDNNDDSLNEEGPPLRTLAPLTSLVSLTMPLNTLIQCNTLGQILPDVAAEDVSEEEMELRLPLAHKLPTSLRSLKILALVKNIEWEEVDMQLADLMRDPSFEKLTRVELVQWYCPDSRTYSAWDDNIDPPGEEEDLSNLAALLEDTAWHSREEVRRLSAHHDWGTYDHLWDIFERAECR